MYIYIYIVNMNIYIYTYYSYYSYKSVYNNNISYVIMQIYIYIHIIIYMYIPRLSKYPNSRRMFLERTTGGWGYLGPQLIQAGFRDESGKYLATKTLRPMDKRHYYTALKRNVITWIFQTSPMCQMPSQLDFYS